MQTEGILVEALSRWTGFVLRLAAGLAMIVLIVAIGVNVFMRYVLGSPMPWAEEVTRYTMVYMTYLAAPLALREGRHIRITLLTERLRGRAAVAVNMLGYLVVGVLAAVVVRQGWGLVQMVEFQRSPALRITMSIPYFGVVLGYAFLLLESLVLFAVNALRFARPVPETVTAEALRPNSKGVDV